MRAIHPDVLALQEANPAPVKTLAQSGLFADVFSAIELTTVKPSPKRYTCAVAVRHSGWAEKPELLPLPVPEQSLVVPLSLQDGKQVLAVSVHIPNGSNWRVVKSETYARLADWLKAAGQCVLLGIDTNSPKVDHPEHSQKQGYSPQ